MKRSRIGNLIGAAAIGLAFVAGPAAAYPDKPVTYIIPFGAGGESGVTARLQEPVFKRFAGQDLVIKYRPGGGGAVVWNQLNAMPADGYTIVGINLPHIILQPLRGAKYKTRDIAAVSIFHYTPHALIVDADSRPKTFNDLMEEIAKRRVTFSGSGKGSANHLAQVQFDRLKGVKTAYKPYKGTAASIQALLQGKVDAAWGYTTVGAKYRGDVLMLAVAMEERHPEFPDVPTFKELGIDMVGGAYRGIAVPKKTPEAIKQRLSKLVRDITYDADYDARQTALGFMPLDVPLEDVEAFIKDRIAEIVPLARAAGLIK